jgi:fatty-acyl-CoA synthase
LLDGLDLGGATVRLVDRPDWREELAVAAPDDVPARPPEPGDTFMLIFTSGSTAAPKAVVMSHRRAAGAANDSTWFGADDVLYCAMPMFHGNAINAVVLPALSGGAAIALRDRFSASEFMSDVRSYGATFFTSVGRALGYVLATPPTDLDQQHSVKYALAPESSRADVKEFQRRFGITCVTGYGSSENAVIMVPARGIGADALGRPKEGIEAAIVDRETGEFRPVAEFDEHGKLANAGEAIGEIVGLNVSSRFEGYYNNPEAEAARNRNGWYWTGDLGYQDSEGVFYFAGRLDDWLRVDSENFATAPVERILVRYPPAAAVAVYAVPDERTADDQVMAAIELDAGAGFDPDDFVAFLTEQRDMSAKWMPRYVRITTIPVGATNKIDRRTLRSARWYTDDPIFWRPTRELRYERFTADDLRELEQRFADHGRALDRP